MTSTLSVFDYNKQVFNSQALIYPNINIQLQEIIENLIYLYKPLYSIKILLIVFDEIKSSPIDAISNSSRLRTIIKHMT